MITTAATGMTMRDDKMNEEIKKALAEVESQTFTQVAEQVAAGIAGALALQNLILRGDHA